MEYILSGVIAAIVTLGIAWSTGVFKLGYKLGRLDGKLDWLTERVKQVETRIDSFMLALLSKKSGEPNEKLEALLHTLIEKFDKFLPSLKTNPLTQGELQKIREYRNKIANRTPLTQGEYIEFEALARKIESDLPPDQRNEYDLVIAGLLGFAMGLLVASLFSEH